MDLGMMGEESLRIESRIISFLIWEAYTGISGHIKIKQMNVFNMFDLK